MPDERTSKLFALRLLLSFLAAPLAWTLHLLLSYFVVTVGCATHWGGTRFTLAILTVCLGAAALWPVWRLRHSWPGFRLIEWLAVGEEQTPTPRFLLGLGFVTTGTFVLAIILGGIGPWLVTLCTTVEH